MTSGFCKTNFDLAVHWLRAAESVVVFTGSSLNETNNLSTFCAPGGFCDRFPPAEFADWKGLLQSVLLQPNRFAQFLIEILKPVALSLPSASHQAIAELEQLKSVEVVTQNIDRLHQCAGSRIVHELRGNLFEIVRVGTGEIVRVLTREDFMGIIEELEEAQQGFWNAPRIMTAINPLLGRDALGLYRPRLIFWGDQLADANWTAAQDAVQSCNLFISIGTIPPVSSPPVSSEVSFTELARAAGAKVIVIDAESGGGDLWLSRSPDSLLPELISAVSPHDGAKDD